MSGLEVVGLIFGAIPLLIAALEHYEDTTDKARTFFKFGAEISTAIRKLNITWSSYDLSIRLLISSVAVDDQELEKLLSSPTSDFWALPDLNRRLEERLSTVHGAFVMTIGDIETVVKQLLLWLDLDRASGAAADDIKAVVEGNLSADIHKSKSRFEFRRRIKFTAKKNKMKRLLDQMEQSIARLDNFNDKVDKLEPYKNTRKSRFTSPLHQIQQSATTLHRVFNRISNCATHTSHSTGLRLQHRLSKKKASYGGNSSGAEDVNSFVLAVSHGHPFDMQKSAEVRVLELEEESEARNKTKIKFSLPPSDKDATIGYSNPRLDEIADICTTMCSLQLTSACAGFVIDGSGKLTGVYPSQQALLMRGTTLVTLHDLLAGKQQGSTKLTKEDCYQLAVTLSSSVLQLKSTPWLGCCWDKRDIAFAQHDEQKKDGAKCSKVHIQDPYLVHLHCEPGTVTTNRTSDSSKLLALGVMLLEIYFNKPIEQLYPPTQPRNATEDELYDLGVLKKWINQEKGNLSWAFQNAVSHCLRCFADPCADLENPDFRQGFIEAVLMPLQDELSLWVHGPTKS